MKTSKDLEAEIEKLWKRVEDWSDDMHARMRENEAEIEKLKEALDVRAKEKWRSFYELQEKVERLEKIHPEGSHPGHRKRFSEMNDRLTSLEANTAKHEQEIGEMEKAFDSHVNKQNRTLDNVFRWLDQDGALQKRVERLETRLHDVLSGHADRLTSLETQTDDRGEYPRAIIQRGDDGFWLRLEATEAKSAGIHLEVPRGSVARDALELCVTDDVRTKGETPPNSGEIIKKAREVVYNLSASKVFGRPGNESVVALEQVISLAEQARREGR